MSVEVRTKSTGAKQSGTISAAGTKEPISGMEGVFGITGINGECRVECRMSDNKWYTVLSVTADGAYGLQLPMMRKMRVNAVTFTSGPWDYALDFQR